MEKSLIVLKYIIIKLKFYEGNNKLYLGLVKQLQENRDRINCLVQNCVKFQRIGLRVGVMIDVNLQFEVKSVLCFVVYYILGRY